MNSTLRWTLSMLLACAGYAGAQVINFDDVGDGVDISSHYPGLTFSCAGVHCASPAVFARQTLNPASAPNTVSLTAAGGVGVHNPTTGTIKVTMCPAWSVSVKARSFPVPEPLNQVQHAILVAQNSSGATIGQAVGTATNQFETLTVNSGTDLITTVFVGVEGTGVAAVAQFDDFSVQCAPVVLPILWLLIILFIIVVLFVLAVLIIKRRKRA